MAWADYSARIVEVLKAKTHPSNCVMCQHNNWILADGFVSLSVAETPGASVLGGKVLPSVAMVCGNCGNTLIINLIALGLRDLLEQQTQTRPPGPVPHDSRGG